MNEYKEALDLLCSDYLLEDKFNEENPNEFFSIQAGVYFKMKYKAKLARLVCRATPKKPYEGHYEEAGQEPYIKYSCPNRCIERQVFSYMKFCTYCGQAILWEDEE